MAAKLTPSAISPSVVPVAPVAPPVQPASVPNPVPVAPGAPPMPSAPAGVPPGAPVAPPVETAQPHTAHVVPLSRMQPPAGVVVRTGKQPVKISSEAVRIIPANTKATIPEADAKALGKSVTRE